MNPVTRARLGSLLLAATLLAMGCSPGPAEMHEQVVFSFATGFGQGMRHVTPVDVVDVGVPALHNLTGRSVRVRKVSLVSVPAAVRLVSVTAHSGQPVGVITGNLVRLCRTSYPSHPVAEAVTPPHANSNWFLVMAITFARPGRYNLRRVKIYYTTGGHADWQYQNLFTTIYVTAARRGTRPRFDGCP